MENKDIKDEKKLKYAGVVVTAEYDKKWYVLLGREAIVPQWSESGKWSDFGGTPESSDANIKESMARECYEETMGILGCIKILTEKINAGRIHDLNTAQIAVIEITYDANLPIHYNAMYNYLSGCTVDHPTWKPFKYIPTCPKGYCEKIEMQWFQIEDVVKPKDPNIFRSSFLQSIKKIFHFLM